MSSLKFNRKLLPATKAWKSFTSTLQKKLHKLKRSKAIKKTTKHLSSILRKNQSKSSSPSPPRFSSSSTISKNRSKSPRYRSNKKRVFLHLHQHNQHQHFKQSYAPVYIDQLFKEPTIMVEHQQPKVPKLVVSTKGKAIEESTSTSTSITLDLQQLRGVDERAEEFINKFKEEMRLQRQRSFGEYKEMLERGVN